MNRDPFDSLRARNPVRPESLPDAPMTVATRITAGRPTLRRGLAIAGATAVAVLAAGSAWLLWTSGGGRETAVEMTTTTLAPASTVAPGTPVTATAVTVYFLDEETNTLVPVARDLTVLNVWPLPDLGPLTIELLLRGPGAWDAAPLPSPVGDAEAQMSSMIPDRTRLLGFVVDAGAATIDLSTEFVDAPPRALAQVVLTATSLAGVTGVNFQVEGVPQAVSFETLSLVPADDSTPLEALVDPVTPGTFEGYLSPITIQSPAAGGTLSLPGEITGLAAGGTADDVLFQIMGEDGTLLWSGTVPGCPDCPAGEFVVELPASAPAGEGWAILRAYSSPGSRALAEYPVWLQPSQAEATTTTTTPTTTTTTIPSTIAANAAPWSAQPLAANAVPAVAADTWAAAENAQSCALLFPADPGALANGAVLHDRYFGGGWGLAWDLPSGPGRWEPGGDYCADCGREAFGVAGTGGDANGTEDAIWPNRLEWTEGSAAGPLYSHAGYGYEGVTSGSAGEPLLAYLFIDGQGCMYNVWSFLGEEHLLALIDQLGFVESMGASPISP